MFIPTRVEIVTGLHAAWRMLLFDARAVENFDASVGGAIKSFFCAVVVLPGYLLLMSLHDGFSPSGDRDPIVALLGEAELYVMLWVAWPLAMFYVARLLGREGNYLRYVTAYNWSAGPQVLLHVTVSLAAASGMLGEAGANVLRLIVLILVLTYQYFVARVALDTTPLPAFGVIVGDFFLAQTLVELPLGFDR